MPWPTLTDLKGPLPRVNQPSLITNVTSTSRFPPVLCLSAVRRHTIKVSSITSHPRFAMRHITFPFSLRFATQWSVAIALPPALPPQDTSKPLKFTSQHQRAFKRAALDALDTLKLPSNAPLNAPSVRPQTCPQCALKRLKRALNAPSPSMPST